MCFQDEILVTPNLDCLQKELHTPQPEGYIQWHDWAASMNYKKYSQRRCPGCNLYLIWS
jgi:hypothetical protein